MSKSSSSPEGKTPTPDTRSAPTAVTPDLLTAIAAAKEKHLQTCRESSRHEVMFTLNLFGSPVLISAGIFLLNELRQLSAEATNPLVLLAIALGAGLTGATGLLSMLAIPKDLEKSKKAGVQAQQDYKDWLKLTAQTYEGKPRR